MKYLVVLSAAIALGIAELASSSSLFAAPSAGDPTAQSESLQEIVVTATKRESSIEKTPMSISAVTGDELAKEGVSSIDDVAFRTPGVGLTSQGPGRTTFTIRGMSPTGGATPTVGYYLDEAPISAPAGQFSGRSEIDPDLYDVQRVEILRGPQGTLFGAGSMGGTIRILLNSPAIGSFDAGAQSTLSGTQHGGFNYGTNGMLNIPLGDSFAFRLVATNKFSDGFIDRVVLNPFPAPSADFLSRGNVQGAPVERVYNNVNDDHTQAVRASLLGQFSDAFSVKASVMAQRIGQGGADTIDFPQDNYKQYQPFDIREGYRDNFSLYTLVLKYQLDPISITSASSLISRSNITYNNDSENYYSLFAPGFFTSGPTSAGTNSNEVTQELRVNSNSTGPLQWVAGVFFDNFHDTNQFNEEAAAYAPIFGEGQIFDFEEHDHLRQTAAFTEVTYLPADKLSLTAGLRYFNYRFDFWQSGVGIVIPPANQTASGSATKSGLNPKATIQYTPDDTQMYYFTAARGFRPGAPNPPVPGNVSAGVDCADNLAALGLKAAPAAYDPDSVWSYELGAKIQPSKRFQFNADVYHLLWTNIQQGVNLPCGFSFTTNAGDAIANGVEIELTQLLFGGLTLTQSAGYTHARLIHQSLGGSQGDYIENVPDWTLSAGLAYEHPLGDNWNVVARLDDQFIGREYNPPRPYPLQFEPGFNTVNLRVGAKRDKLSVELFVKNATDRNAIVGFSPGLSAGIPSVTRAVPIQPRRAGIDLQWSFR